MTNLLAGRMRSAEEAPTNGSRVVDMRSQRPEQSAAEEAKDEEIRPQTHHWSLVAEAETRESRQHHLLQFFPLAAKRETLLQHSPRRKAKEKQSLRGRGKRKVEKMRRLTSAAVFLLQGIASTLTLHRWLLQKFLLLCHLPEKWSKRRSWIGKENDPEDQSLMCLRRRHQLINSRVRERKVPGLRHLL